MCSAQSLSACATLESAAEDEHLRALCAFKDVEGRVDLIPAGPGTHTLRIVTLDRGQVLSTLQNVDPSASQGIAKVRVESPRPMVALLLKVEEASPAIAPTLAWTPLPLTLVLTPQHPELEAIQRWADRHFVNIVQSGAKGELNLALEPSERIELRGLSPKAVDEALEALPSILERRGSVWIYGTLTPHTLDALRRHMKRDDYPLHVVSHEHLERPPKDASWRLRCLTDID